MDFCVCFESEEGRSQEGLGKRVSASLASFLTFLVKRQNAGC